MDYEIILEGFPNLVDGLAHFFDEKCPNEIVKYRPDLRIIEPSYCKDGRIKHNKSIHTQSFDYGWRGARATARCTPRRSNPALPLGKVPLILYLWLKDTISFYYPEMKDQ